MARFAVRRLLLSLVTLFLLLTIVFVIVNVLPDDPGRRIAGPFAPQETVDALNERLGVNDPLTTQYVRLIRNTVTFDFGDSFKYNRPVSAVIKPALWRSTKLVVLALILTLPLSIAAGLYAARRRGTGADRAIVTVGLGSSSIPEFVSGVVLQYILAVSLGILPVLALAPRGASFLTEMKHLLLPALALVVVYFGYIARMTRAGAIRSLESDYARTAVMKGLSRSQITRRHVLRNGLQPTVAVVGTQIGYMFSALVGLEIIFAYPGTRKPDIRGRVEEGLSAPHGRGHPRRHHLHADDPRRRPHHRLDEPARQGRASVMSTTTAPVPSAMSSGAAERRQARRERMRLLTRRPSFIIGMIIALVWIVCAIGGSSITPYDPIDGFSKGGAQPPSSEHLMGTDQLGRDVLSRVMAGARDVLIAAPVAAVIAIVLGSFLGLMMGYLRGIVDEVIGRIIEALMSIPVILIALLIISVLGSSTPVVIGTVALLFTPVVARTVRSAVIAEAELDYVVSARLRGESSLFIMAREILPNVTAPIVVEFTVRVGYAIFTIATLSFLGAGIQPPSPDWGLTISETYRLIIDGQWWPSLFPALAIASLVVATNLIADSIEEVQAT